MAQLQVALDVESLRDARSLARSCVGYNVRIEVGTPLIIKHGMAAVRSIRQQLPHHFIVADCKTMDRGTSIVRMCAEAGADSVIVQAAAGTSTLEEASREAARHGIEIMLDSLGATCDLVRQLQVGGRVHHTIRHIGKDEQRLKKHTALEVIRGENYDHSSDPMNADAIAGGITWQAVRACPRLLSYSVIIVGEYFYAAPRPTDVVNSFVRLLHVSEAA